MRSALSVLSVMIADAERTTEDIEWCILHWKELLEAVKQGTDADEQLIKLVELSICEQLRAIADALLPVLNAKIPAGAVNEPIVRLLKKYFTVMGNLAKIVRFSSTRLIL